MTSSKHPGPRQVPPPPGSRAGSPSYSRFIPREELQGFANWSPGSFGGEPPSPHPGGAPAAAGAPSEEALAAELQAQLHDAHQAGYQDGYRDGLVALDSFKQSFAQQTTQQVGLLVAALDAQFDALEAQMADAVRRTATLLARQVVRAEIDARPELVAQVAAEAVNAVLMSARHISVHVNPQDHALVAAGAAEALAGRGARLLPDAGIARGGCKVVSDVGTIDAGIEARWAQAAAAMGSALGWNDEAEPLPEDAP